MDKEEIKSLLKKYSLSPNKVLGQNFLQDDQVVLDMVDAAEVGKRDEVLEIGPGLGVVTRVLASKAKRLVSVEKDLSLKPLLSGLEKEYENFQAVYEDFLKINLSQLFKAPYKLVANLPYYAASPILRHCLDSFPRPISLTFLVQREVAENMSAKKEMSLLALAVQLHAEVSVVRSVEPGSFFPSPKVKSAIVHLKTFKKPLVNKDAEKKLFWVAGALFKGKRKQIHNTLEHNLRLDKNEVELVLSKSGLIGSERPGSLNLAQFIRLAEACEGFNE